MEKGKESVNRQENTPYPAKSAEYGVFLRCLILSDRYPNRNSFKSLSYEHLSHGRGNFSVAGLVNKHFCPWQKSWRRRNLLPPSILIQMGSPRGLPRGESPPRQGLRGPAEALLRLMKSPYSELSEREPGDRSPLFLFSSCTKMVHGAFQAPCFLFEWYKHVPFCIFMIPRTPLNCKHFRASLRQEKYISETGK